MRPFFRAQWLRSRLLARPIFAITRVRQVRTVFTLSARP